MQGKSINGYTLQKLLGEGGMAEVWYAENKIHKKAAVKFLKKKFCDDENVVTRFRNEAEVMVGLNHPNIRQVYDYDELDGRPAIIMEYLEGNDLKARMKRGERFGEQQLEKWWNQMADALNYTHKKGVVHRDIKPSNIFIDTEGNVRLMDFGIAKVKESISSTQTGAAMGTLLYMSPEQIDDVKRVDYRTDVYSLAVTFVHLLTGKAPYDATTTSDYQIRKSIVENPLDLSALPRAWRSFLEPYLAKGREQRPVLRHVGFDDGRQKDDDETFYDSGKKEQKETSAGNDGTKPKPGENEKPKNRKGLWIGLGAAAAVVVAICLIPSGGNSQEKNLKQIDSYCTKADNTLSRNDLEAQNVKWNDYTNTVDSLVVAYQMLEAAERLAADLPDTEKITRQAIIMKKKKAISDHVQAVYQQEKDNYNATTDASEQTSGQSRMSQLDKYYDRTGVQKNK